VTAVQATPFDTRFLAGGGKSGELIAAHDWAATPLGPIENWPASLRIALGMILNSGFPSFLAWGPQLISFYNDAYRPFLGSKPEGIGRPLPEVWAEIWDEIGPITARGMAGHASFHENEPLLVPNDSAGKQIWRTFSCSPVRNEDGTVGGVLCTILETTPTVLAERRLRFLVELGDTLRAAEGPVAITQAAAAALGRYLGANRTGYGEFDPSGEVVSVKRDWTDGTVASLAGETRTIMAFGPALVSELRAGRTLVVEDCHTDPRTSDPSHQAVWDRTGVRAAIVVPLIHGGRLSAALYTHSSLPRTWTAAEVALAEDVAMRTWAAYAQARAEADLRESEARMELAVSASGGGIWDWDLLTNRFTCSPRAKAIYGFAPDQEVTYKGIRRVIHPEDLPLVAAAARRALDPAIRAQPIFEYRIVRPDGAVRHVVAHGKVVFALVDGQERAVRYAGSLQDITERWWLQQERVANEARLRLALGAGRMAAWEADMETGALVGTPELKRLLGFADHENPTVYDVMNRYYPGERERLQAVGKAARERGEQFAEAEFRYVRPDGSLRWMLLRNQAVLDPEGRMLRAVGVLMDITERKRIEEVLREQERRQAFLLELGDNLRKLTEPAAIMGAAAEALGRHLGASRVGYCEVEPGQVHFTVPRDWTDGTVVNLTGRFRMDDFSPLLAAEMMHGRTAAQDDVATHPLTAGAKDSFAAIQIRSNLAVPLIKGGILTAMMFVNYRDTHAWTTDEISLVEDVAERTWSAVERARAESLLKESEARFRGVFESDLMGFSILDTRTGETLAINDSLLRMTGYTRADFEAGRGDRRAFTPEEYRAIDEAAIALARSRGWWDPYEKEYLRPDGTRLPVRVSSAPLPGEPGRVVVSVQDITQERAALAALRESEERFRTIADSAPALIWMTDTEAQVTFANTHHERKFDLPPEAILRNGWRQVVHADDVEAFSALFANAIRTRKPFVSEIRVWDKKGRLRWLSCQGVPRFDGAGTYLGHTGTNVDITEARIARDELERLIEERTAELAAANRQLVGQIEEREKVEATLRKMQRLEAVGQLTSGVAHDFNNLLTVVLGNIGFVERAVAKAGVDDKILDRLGYMRTAAERGATLTAQLLAFSRRQRLEAKPVDLNETVAGMRDLLQSSMGGSVQLQTVLEPGLWPALVDPTQIELVILNLAINARDAMEVGGSLTVETENVTLGEPIRPEEPPPGDYVMVSVADTGTGMTDEVLAKAFEPFFTTKPVGKGSGLGLAQVYGFAKQSGGGVRIETRLGAGTTVKVFLPRAAQPNAVARETETFDSGDRIEGPPRRVLLVDDDNAVREVTAIMLQDLGCEVVEAGSGGAALDIIERDPQPFDLMVVDFAMPGMNGAEVAREVAVRRPGLPVLFVTGYADLTALGDVAEDRIVQKPFRGDVLTAKVRRLLGVAERMIDAVPLSR